MSISTGLGYAILRGFEHVAARVPGAAIAYKRYKGMGTSGEEPTPVYWTSLSISVYTTGDATAEDIEASGGLIQEGFLWFKFRVTDFTSSEVGEPSEPDVGDIVVYDGNNWSLDLEDGSKIVKEDPTGTLFTVWARRLS